MKRIEASSLRSLIDSLRRHGFTVVGPTVRDSAIVYDVIHSAEDLPQGWTDTQANGSYKIHQTGGKEVFGFAAGPVSPKRFLHPPLVDLLTVRRNKQDVEFELPAADPRRYAFFGVRPCDAEAVARQDQVLMNGPFPDTVYRDLRRNSCIIVVNCLHPSGTCFCASVGTGPRGVSGFDIALTEIATEGDHYFLAEEGTPLGSTLLHAVEGRPATEEEIDEADRRLTDASGKMGKQLDTDGLKEILYDRLSDQHWESIGSRCLTCANCTLVCPTCFCFSTEEAADLSGVFPTRRRRWDSCFTLDFSYIHGGHVRASAAARYRQWMMHKLATWIDQFGTSGCVGCGRCITWCPVGIDITEEARTLRTKAGVTS